MLRIAAVLIFAAVSTASAHDAHGRANAPLDARHLKNPLATSDAHLQSGKALYNASCAGCHGEDGKARTALAGSLPVRPTDLSDYLMESMREGEIYWVITHGIDRSMPAFDAKLSETDRWELVLYVRELRKRQQAIEVAHLGPYRWQLPPGFPYPNVPADNPMTEEKVELGRHLFYDRRLSLNQTQSCATCHQQKRAFTDARGRGVGSTGQVHPRGPMSLANVAYSPVLTWANPNLRSLEKQALVPLFGDDPVELGFSGKESILLARLRAQPLYRELFAAAFRGQQDAFTLGNIMNAIACFERTILSGDSPYDRYRRGVDPQAISDSAKRGEALFFSERLECFHCHGGFNFTGTVDYYGKGFSEVEFHNTGLYNLQGKFSYPEPNLGLYTFTQAPDDVGKFKAPTLRNIAVTAPYMHDGSVKTLEEVIEHYAAGGRTIQTGPNAGVGADNPNKSEFVKSFSLSGQEKGDLLAFLNSLTDESLLNNPSLANPWTAAALNCMSSRTPCRLRAEVSGIFPQDSTIALYLKADFQRDYDAIPGLKEAVTPPSTVEFLVADRDQLKTLQPGQDIVAWVHKEGRDFVLDSLRAAPKQMERIDHSRKKS